MRPCNITVPVFDTDSVLIVMLPPAGSPLPRLKQPISIGESLPLTLTVPAGFLPTFAPSSATPQIVPSASHLTKLVMWAGSPVAAGGPLPVSLRVTSSTFEPAAEAGPACSTKTVVAASMAASDRNDKRLVTEPLLDDREPQRALPPGVG